MIQDSVASLALKGLVRMVEQSGVDSRVEQETWTCRYGNNGEAINVSETLKRVQCGES
jgi:hypothetical protein